MQFDSLIPRATNRVFLCGMTGSGKSVLARYLLESRRQNLILVFDAKDEIFWPGFQRFTKLQNLIRANPRHAIYAPNIRELDSPSYHDWFFKFGFLRQKKNRKKKLKIDTTVYVDEAYAVTHNETLPFYYKAGLTRGRSIGLELWSATQRPKNIPQFLISESEDKYIFFLQMPQDKKKLTETIAIPRELVESLSMDNHEFVYCNLNKMTGKLKLKGVS